ncbi:hypothetical protein AB6805_30420 [Chitinophaga sp. RCC_12]|uniref:hypothetical protein n=1 Tax=Chitinophaga sp. RCC_12 TaxID=3239226 RepID=UPI0035258001
MTQKICTHPDGCQNEEKRHCLLSGCKFQGGKLVTLTPKEQAAEKYLKERYGTDYIPEHWIKTVVEYAAQKMVESEENATWAHDKLQDTQEELVFYKDQLSKKDALLKEATRILTDYLTGKSSMRLFKADARIHLRKFKTTGREAGKDE